MAQTFGLGIGDGMGRSWSPLAEHHLRRDEVVAMPRHLPPDLIDEVRERTRHRRSRLSVRRCNVRAGGRRALPLSYGKDAFVLRRSREEQLFHCFRLPSGGNVFNFLMRSSGHPSPRLCDDSGRRRRPDRQTEVSPGRRAAGARLRSQIAKALEIACRYYVGLSSDEGAGARRVP